MRPARSARSSTGGAAVLALGCVAVTGCFAFDWDYVGGGESGAGAGPTASSNATTSTSTSESSSQSSSHGGASTTTSTTGSGGGVPCTNADGCPIPGACQIAACQGGFCAVENAELYTDCGTDEVCDGNGACVRGGVGIALEGFDGNPTGPEPLNLAVDIDGTLYMTTVGAGSIGTVMLTDPSLVKLDPSGMALSANSLGIGSPKALTLGGHNRAYVGGTFNGTGDIGAMCPPADAAGGFVSAIQFGICQWTTTLGGARMDTRVDGIAAVTGGTDDLLTVTGTFSGNLTANTLEIVPTAQHQQMFVSRFMGSVPNWTIAFGDSTFVAGSNGSVAVDSTGNVFVAGTFRGSITFDQTLASPVAGPSGVYLAKLDPTGAPVWSKSLGSDVSVSGRSIAVDSHGNVAVVGVSQGEAKLGPGHNVLVGGFAAMYDPTGKYLWGQGFPPVLAGVAATVSFSDVAFDPLGNLAVTGELAGDSELGQGDLNSARGGNSRGDALVFKLSGADGTTLWASGYGDGSLQQGIAIAETAASKTFVAGFVEGSIDFGTGPFDALQSGFLAELGP